MSRLTTQPSLYPRPCEPCTGLTAMCEFRSITINLAGFWQPWFNLSIAKDYVTFINHRERLCICLTTKGLNLRQSDYASDALPAELIATASMCVLCCCINFWPTQYNTPNVVRPADYLTDFRELRASCETRNPLNLCAALACEAWTCALPFPASADELVEHGWTAPPVSFSPASVPSCLRTRPLSRRSLPCNSLHRLRHPFGR